jgi:hypothetical protein
LILLGGIANLNRGPREIAIFGKRFLKRIRAHTGVVKDCLARESGSIILDSSRCSLVSTIAEMGLLPWIVNG